MIQETVRRLKDQERRSLEEQLAASSPVTGRETLKWGFIWTGGLTMLGLFAAGLIAIGPNPVLAGLVGGILVVAGIICLYALIITVSSFFHWRKGYRDFAANTIPLIRKVLAEDQVLSRDVTASEVYEIEAFEDEGSGYIFALGTGKSLLLKGQKYVPDDDQMPWPATEFSLVRSVDNSLWIGVFSSGQEMSPARTVEMQECSDEFIWSEREEVIDGQPEDVLKGIMKSHFPGP